MGRPGQGGGGGHSGGGHSGGSRSGGGHRIGGTGGHRPGQGGFGGGASRGSSGGFGGGMPPRSPMGGGMPPRSPFGGLPRRHSVPVIVPIPVERNRRSQYDPPPPGYGPGPGRPASGGSGCGNLFGGLLAMFVLLVLLLIIISSCGGSSSHSSSSGYYSNQVSSANTSGDIPASTTDREKADAGISFTTDCITDQIGWVSNPTATCKNMKDFYSKTGLQPMVLLKSYDSSLKTDDEKYDYAQQYYTDHITNEGSVLYVYFAEQDEENDVGYMALINGKQAGAVMDAEARDIFWAYLDSYWYSDMDMGDVLSTTYNNTANRIMTKTTTKADIIKAVIIGLIVVIVVVSVVILVVKLVKEKNRRAKEEAEETERILNTPLQNEADPMLAKYETSSESQPATQPPGTDGTGSAGQQ